MKSTIEWLDAAKQRHALSDYAMAPKLGVTRQQMSRYRNGHDFLSEASAIRLAALLEVEPLVILASAAAERAARAQSEEVRQVWAKYAGALVSVAGLAVVAGTLLSAPFDAHASMTGTPLSQGDAVHYVN